MDGNVAIRVAVIGAGISGLVAANELAKTGAEVTVFEAQKQPGGRIKSGEIAGVSFDTGAEAFATRGGTVARFLQSLGLDSEIVHPSPSGSWLASTRGSVPMPPAGTLGIPAQPLAESTLRVLGKAAAEYAAKEPERPAEVGKNATTIGELVEARLGAEVLERLVRPVALGVYSTDPFALQLERFPDLTAAYAQTGSLLSAAAALRDKATAAGGAVASFRGGMHTLITRMTEIVRGLGVRLRLATPVTAIHETLGGWKISGEEDAHLGDFDALLIATGETDARTLFSLPAEVETVIEAVTIAVQDERLDSAPRGTGALVVEPGETAGIQAKALTHSTSKWEWLSQRAGTGRHVFRLSYGATGAAPATLSLDDDSVLQLALRDASAIFGVALGADSVLGMRRQVWRFTVTGGAELGESELAQLAGRSRLIEGSPLAFTGDWVFGTGLASVIPGAQRAARELLHAAAEQRQETTA